LPQRNRWGRRGGDGENVGTVKARHTRRGGRDRNSAARR
jgi:hypothetical protein